MRSDLEPNPSNPDADNHAFQLSWPGVVAAPPRPSVPSPSIQYWCADLDFLRAGPPQTQSPDPDAQLADFRFDPAFFGAVLTPHTINAVRHTNAGGYPPQDDYQLAAVAYSGATTADGPFLVSHAHQEQELTEYKKATRPIKLPQSSTKRGRKRKVTSLASNAPPPTPAPAPPRRAGGNTASRYGPSHRREDDEGGDCEGDDTYDDSTNGRAVKKPEIEEKRKKLLERNRQGRFFSQSPSSFLSPTIPQQKHVLISYPKPL
jgi:hypothetical protein